MEWRGLLRLAAVSDMNNLNLLRIYTVTLPPDFSTTESSRFLPVEKVIVKLLFSLYHLFNICGHKNTLGGFPKGIINLFSCYLVFILFIVP